MPCLELMALVALQLNYKKNTNELFPAASGGELNPKGY
jgi:hypothetical protein